MNKTLLRVTAVALSILILTFAFPVSALYRGVLGEVFYVKTAQIGAGVEYTEYHSVTDGLNERAYVFEYRAGEGAFPIVSFGDKLTGSNRVNTLAGNECENGNNIIGGVNGDFFSVQTGIPMGTAIRDGRLLTDDDNNSAVGFTYDGETIFGNPDIRFTVLHTYEKPDEEESSESDGEILDQTEELPEELIDENIEEEEEEEISEEYPEEETEADETEESTSEEETNEETSDIETTEAETYIEIIDGIEYVIETLPVSYFNKYPTEWGAYLLDDMFSDSTRSKKDSLEIVIQLDDSDAFAKIGETLSGEVIGINAVSKDTKLKKGQLIISVCETSTYRPAYDHISLGDRIDITFEAAEGWENVESAIGGSDVFIKDGVIDESVIGDSHEKIANPRTAVGVLPDGTVLIFAADGRQDISYGFRMISLARTLLSFGCVYAINLDGGGSTTAVVKYPHEDGTSVANSPSDKAPRAVSNALLLVDNTEPDNVPRYIIPENASPIILTGESYSFNDIKFCDSSLTEVIFSKDEEENSRIIDGLLQNLEIKFDKSRLYYYRDLEMPDLGTISDDGKVYTADGETGEIPLMLTSEYGDYLLSGRAILFVANSPDEIISRLESNIFAGTEGFEVAFDSFYMGSRVPSAVNQVEFELTDDIIITPYESENDKALAYCSIGYIDSMGGFVPYEDADGSAILKLSLNGKIAAETRIVVGSGILPLGGEIEFGYDFPAAEVSEDAESQSDESDDITEANTEASTEETITEAENESSSEISEVSSEASELSVEPSETSAENTETASEIYTQISDEVTIHTEDIIFENDFDITNVKSLDLYASQNELTMYAEAGDERIEYVLQNEPENSGIYHYRASLEGVDGELISLLRIDANDNGGKSGILKINNISVAFTDTETVFADTYGHWAKLNINSLYRMQIVGGEEYGGKYIFSPERSLSRAEFAVMMSRALEYDLEEYTEAPEFADLDEIPEWALPHIRAVSENGLMNGKRISDDIINFDYSGKITRQEIMQVIGNLIKSLKEQEDANDQTIIVEEIFENDELTENAEAVPDIADIASVAEWAYNNVLLTLESKIITGYSDNTIRPLNNVTRAEAATIILRTVNTFDLQ